jgi:formylmethanofuran dehydrogenase subunit E-like metal-binding protein
VNAAPPPSQASVNAAIGLQRGNETVVIVGTDLMLNGGAVPTGAAQVTESAGGLRIEVISPRQIDVSYDYFQLLIHTHVHSGVQSGYFHDVKAAMLEAP